MENMIKVQVLFCEAWSDFLCARRGPELRQVPQGEAGGLLGLQTQDCRGPHQLQQEVLSPRLHEGCYYFSQFILDGFITKIFSVLCVWRNNSRKVPYIQRSTNL